MPAKNIVRLLIFLSLLLGAACTNTAVATEIPATETPTETVLPTDTPEPEPTASLTPEPEPTMPPLSAEQKDCEAVSDMDTVITFDAKAYGPAAKTYHPCYDAYENGGNYNNFIEFEFVELGSVLVSPELSRDHTWTLAAYAPAEWGDVTVTSTVTDTDTEITVRYAIGIVIVVEAEDTGNPPRSCDFYIHTDSFGDEKILIDHGGSINIGMNASEVITYGCHHGNPFGTGSRVYLDQLPVDSIITFPNGNACLATKDGAGTLWLDMYAAGSRLAYSGETSFTRCNWLTAGQLPPH